MVDITDAEIDYEIIELAKIRILARDYVIKFLEVRPLSRLESARLFESYQFCIQVLLDEAADGDLNETDIWEWVVEGLESKLRKDTTKEYVQRIAYTLKVYHQEITSERNWV